MLLHSIESLLKSLERCLPNSALFPCRPMPLLCADGSLMKRRLSNSIGLDRYPMLLHCCQGSLEGVLRWSLPKKGDDQKNLTEHENRLVFQRVGFPQLFYGTTRPL
mgnify:CR=1 FL=1